LFISGPHDLKKIPQRSVFVRWHHIKIAAQNPIEVQRAVLPV
jgi:hypothetical protein